MRLGRLKQKVLAELGERPEVVQGLGQMVAEDLAGEKVLRLKRGKLPLAQRLGRVGAGELEKEKWNFRDSEGERGESRRPERR